MSWKSLNALNVCVDLSFSTEQNAGHRSSSAVQHLNDSLGFYVESFYC